MEYFMIVIIFSSFGNVRVEIPVDNYEHCMEIKDYVVESLKTQFSRDDIRAACPPIQR